MGSRGEGRSGKERAKPARGRLRKDPVVLLELGQGWGTGSDVVLLPPPPMFFACQSADEELAVAALPAGRAFAAASEMRSRCWLKIIK